MLPSPSSPIPLDALRASDLERTDVVFTDGEYVYSTSGRPLARGGSGASWLLTRWQGTDPGSPPEPVVAKLLRPEFLVLVREDEVARRHFAHNRKVLACLRGLDHPNLLATLLDAPIADNHMVVSPLAGESLTAHLASQPLGPRDRALLLVDALRGLAAMHELGIVHRDFTLSNIITLGEPIGPNQARHAALTDFELAVCPEMLPADERSYAAYYQGRINGAPEYSVPPELLDDMLGLHPITARADVYAAGTALFALYTPAPLYGDAPDLATLLYRVAAGLVHNGHSIVPNSDDIPPEVRPIIERCLERDPGARYKDAGAVAAALEEVIPRLPIGERRRRYRQTLGYLNTERRQRQESVYGQRLDDSVTRDEIRRVDEALLAHGYGLEQSLGRVKGHPIYLAAPDHELVAAGRFTEDNVYRKIVTAIDVSARTDGAELVAAWIGRIRPIVERVRQGLLTPLYNVVHDGPTGLLLLFTEYIAEPRFGTELARHDLSLEEVFALGLIIAEPIARLHAEGLAHNNVRPGSLLFKGRRDVGEARAVLVGLVEPSFAVSAREEDVRNVARIVAGLIRRPRIAVLGADERRGIEALFEELRRVVEATVPTPSIEALAARVAGALGLIDRNFELLRVHGGDLQAYADRLVRHSLYVKLFT